MQFVNIPNVPEYVARVVIIDGRADYAIEHKLRLMGIDVVRTERIEGVDDIIAYHPDIMVHHVGGERFVYAPGTSPVFLQKLKDMGCSLIQGQCVLNGRYPGDIAYNVARIGHLAFHNTKYTDPVLRRELDGQGVEWVHVNQGYAKCSISVVDTRSIITSDEGIAAAAREQGLDVLLIAPQKHIRLPGYAYGFIGGCTGLTGPNEWVIAGQFEKLEAASDIRKFLEKKGKQIVSISCEYPLDIGSILPVMTL